MKTQDNFLRTNELNTKIFLLSIILLLSSFTIYAQNSVTRIQGVIQDENLSPLDYATVSLVNTADSTVINVVFTDEVGVYTFNNVKQGKYFIKANMLGFLEGNSKPIEISKNMPTTLSVENLTLKTSTTSLDDIVITVQKPLIERKADMLIVNVENSSLAAGNNALDILERSPGISVDKDDNISLQGRQGTLILIDGKETHLSASQLANLLRSTDGNQIQSLEIITNPSAKYDAKGTSGIINIKLKKNKQTGTNGSLTLSGGYGQTHKSNSSLNVNHKTGKVNLFGTYSYLDNNYNQDISIYRLVGQSTSFTSFDQLSKLHDSRRSNSARVGLDYQSSERNTVGILLNVNASRNKSGNLNNTFIGSHTSPLDSLLKANTDTRTTFNSYSLTLNDVFTIDTLGRKISTDIDLSRFDNENSSLYMNYLYDANSTSLHSPIILRSEMPSIINIQMAKIDYVHPLKEDSKLEAGIKYARVASDNNMVFEKQVDNSWENMEERTNHFLYEEQVAAAYVNYSISIKKLGIQTGIRTEYTRSDGNSLTLNNQVKRSYIDFFPNISLNYNASDKHQFGISYSKRIERPYYSNLNPFTYYLDEYTSVRGNPYLQPEYAQAFSIDYTLMQKFNFSAGVTKTRDAMIESMEQDDLKKTTTIYRDNIASSESWHINANLPIAITKFWNSNTNITSFYLKFKSTAVNNPINTGQLAAQVYNNNTFTINPTLKLEATVNYRSPLAYSIYKIGEEWSIDAGVNKSFMDKKVNLKLAVTDVFNTKSQHITTQHANLDAIINQKRESRVARLTFTYNFGSTKIASRKIDNSSDEKKRVGQ